MIERKQLATQVQDRLQTLNRKVEKQTVRREAALLFIVIALALVPLGVGLVLLIPAVIAYLLHRNAVRTLEGEKRLMADALDAAQPPAQQTEQP